MVLQKCIAIVNGTLFNEAKFQHQNQETYREFLVHLKMFLRNVEKSPQNQENFTSNLQLLSIQD